MNTLIIASIIEVVKSALALVIALFTVSVFTPVTISLSVLIAVVIVWYIADELLSVIVSLIMLSTIKA